MNSVKKGSPKHTAEATNLSFIRYINNNCMIAHHPLNTF